MTATIVTLDRDFILNKLNTLPRHSRLRPGYVDLMRHIRKDELTQDHMARMFDEAVRLAFPDEDDAARVGETY